MTECIVNGCEREHAFEHTDTWYGLAVTIRLCPKHSGVAEAKAGMQRIDV